MTKEKFWQRWNGIERKASRDKEAETAAKIRLLNRLRASGCKRIAGEPFIVRQPILQPQSSGLVAPSLYAPRRSAIHRTFPAM
jgi:hypothetical protein